MHTKFWEKTLKERNCLRHELKHDDNNKMDEMALDPSGCIGASGRIMQTW